MLGNTSTCPYVRFNIQQSLVRPAVGDDFVICRNAHMDMCLCYQVDGQCVLQLMMTLLYIETHVWICACVTKSTSNASVADDDFDICRNANMDLCYQVDVQCVLQLIMILFYALRLLLVQTLIHTRLSVFIYYIQTNIRNIYSYTFIVFSYICLLLCL